MTSYPTSRELTSSLITLLATDTGEQVGDGEAPAGATALLEGGSPYAVVHNLDATQMDGPMSDVNADAWLLYQVTSVGVDRIQAEWMREKCRDAVYGTGTLTMTGRHVMGPIMLEPQSVFRDDTVQPPVWLAIDYFIIPTTPT